MRLHQFDDEYIRRLRQGDPAVESDFLVYFRRLIGIKLKRRCCPPRWLEDIRQETLTRVLAMLRSQGGLEHSGALGSFVNTVCNHVFSEYARSEARTAPIGEAAEIADAPDTELVTWDLRRQVEAVLAELRPVQRAALKMLFLEDKDREEVCQLLGITPAGLRVVLHRARVRFQKKSRSSETIRGSSVTTTNRGGSE